MKSHTSKNDPQQAAAKKFAHRVGSAPHGEFVNLRADLDDLISNVDNLSDIDLKQAKEKLMEKIALIKGAVKDVADPGNERVNHSIKLSQKYVKAHPMKSFAYTALASLFLGSIVKHFSSCPSDCDEPECCTAPRCWCDGYLDHTGQWKDAKCSHPHCDKCKSGQGKYPGGPNNACIRDR